MKEDIVEHMIQKGCFVLHIRFSEQKIGTIAQFLKFCMVGLSNTLVSYGVNVLVLFSLQNANLSWDYIAGNVVAFLTSVLWSFFWNRRLVFRQNEKKRGSLGKSLLKTYASYALTGIVLNNIMSYALIYQLGISKYIAPAINVLISVPLNFILAKFWAFR